MNWKDKSKEIAESLITELDATKFDRHSVLRLLQKAALDGIKYECENWVRQSR